MRCVHGLSPWPPEGSRPASEPRWAPTWPADAENLVGRQPSAQKPDVARGVPPSAVPPPGVTSRRRGDRLGTVPMRTLAALADPTRRRIVELLAQHERSAGELVQEFEMSAPAISQHLKVLREAGLIRTRAEGQFRIHSLNPEGLDELDAWLSRTRRFWSARLDALDGALRADDTKRSRPRTPASDRSHSRRR